jgi:cellulose synthase/poly-beta-1,6-N-acetylglucosamine synthase-like glycosyltransferase
MAVSGNQLDHLRSEKHGMSIGLGLTVLPIGIWLYLLCAWGQFWRCDQRLEDDSANQQLESLPASYPAICAVIPARNEADLLPITLRSLLSQAYPGSFTVILVDDQSTDGTADVAKATAAAIGKLEHLHVVAAAPLPAGWSGKLWAMEQGVQVAQSFAPEVAPDYLLFTDADIQHDPANLRRLVDRAMQQDLDLASVMVRLRCDSAWEKLLIPAFVFFFQKLYPFRWVNDPNQTTAAAAGGCILIRQTALDRIGGLSAIRAALIDDCALAQAVKSAGRAQPATGIDNPPEKERGPRMQAKQSNPELRREPDPQPRSAIAHSSPSAPGTELSTANTLHSFCTSSGRIWLGLSDCTQSLRPYPSLATIWNMVARTAYTQLNYSPFLLLGTLLGMTLVYLVAPIAFIAGLLIHDGLVTLLGLLGWLLMAIAYLPTVRFYHCAPLYACCLPAIALLYTLMTLDSAWRHWRGRGGAWKGRIYP